MRILASAVGFGMGPIGKLCTIIENNKYDWYACGDRISSNIFERCPFLDECWSREERDILEFVNKYSIKYAVVVLDPQVAMILTRIGVKVLYIDSLAFMWNEADLIPFDVEIYCAQKYPGYKTSAVMRKVSNLKWVGPIVNRVEEKKKEDYIVINFGGLHSPFGEGIEYLRIVLDTVLPFFENEEIFVTCGDNVVTYCKNFYPRLKSKTFCHDDFLELVSRSKLFLTSPGLTTIYETCHFDIDTIVLPPQNLSQFYNIDIADKVCRNVRTIGWNTKTLSLEELNKQGDLPEDEIVKKIYMEIKKIANDKEYLDLFSNMFQMTLSRNSRNNFSDKIDCTGLEDVSKELRRMVGE